MSIFTRQVFYNKSRTWVFFLGFLFFSLSFFSQTANAACPGVDASSSPVVYEACTEVKDTDGDNTVSITSPAGTQVGDYLVLAVTHNRAFRSIFPPAGWATIDVGANLGNGNNDVTFGVYALFATVAGPQTYNITLGNNDGDDQIYAWMMRFSNTDGMLNNEFSALGGDGDDATSPAVTPTVANSLILRMIGADDDDVADDDEGGFTSPMMTGHLDITRGSSGTGNQSVSGSAVYTTQAVANVSSGAGTFTNFPGNEQWRSVTMALRPKVVTPPGSGPSVYGNATCNDYSNTFGTTSLIHSNGIPLGGVGSNRMVLVAWSGEGNHGATSVTFDTQPMQLVASEYLDDGNNDSTTELYAILDSDLPMAAGTTYPVAINGTPADFAICIVTLEDVEQIIPTGNGNGLPVNVFSQDNPPSPDVATIITTPADNSLVFSLTGNGLNGSYSLDSQITELYDVAYQGQGGVFAFGSGVVANQGQITITNSARSGFNAPQTPNRVSQVVAAFGPVQVATVADHFEINHDGAGDVCSLDTVTITVVDVAGVTVSDYVGTVSLTTSSGNGSWTLQTGAGSFSDPVVNDGSASYTFVAGDNGTVILNYNDPVQETVNFNVTDGDLYEDSAFDANFVVSQCTFRISSLVSEFSACNIEDIIIEAYNSSGSPALNYTGTVSITTSSSNGNWISSNGAGTLTDINPNDGVAEYTFVAADNGVVEIAFNDQNVESVNINLDDNGMLEDSAFDPDFNIVQCVPTVAAQCFSQGNLGSAAVTIPSRVDAISSRMVLMYINDEATTDTTSAQLTGPGPTNYPLSFIRREKNTSGAGNTLEVWGALDADLPVDAGTYTASFDGASQTDAAMCLVAASGAKQSFPAADLATPANGQINSSQGTNTRNAVTTINAIANNSQIISAVSTGDNFSTYSSSLSDSLWAAGPANPNGAEFYGNSEFQAFAGAVTVTETNSQASPNRHTHMVLALAPYITGTPLVSSYVPVSLFQTYAGNMNYRATGNSLRTTDNPNSCNMVATGTGSTATIDIPAGSTIRSAYLYWAGSGTYNANPVFSDVDTVVSFGPDGSQISITADDSFLIENPNGLGAGLNFFLNYKVVTSLISTASSTTYRLSDLVVQTGGPWNGNQTCLGGWGLVVVFDNSLENLNVINLFHGFQPFQYSAFTLVPRNFRMASPDVLTNIPNGQITHITFEGDNTLNNGDEGFRLQNDPNNLTFDLLENPFNIGAAQYNNTISYPNYDVNQDFNGTYTGITTSYGADVDTFYLEGANPGDLLHPFATVEAEEITTRYSAGQDLVLLSGEFIALTNAPIADMEVFISESGTFKVNSNGTGAYHYDVLNNGNGGLSNGYADGDIIFTGNMPVGMTINTLSAPGWDCSSIAPTTTAFTCVYEISSNWSGGATFGELAGGESLPTIDVTVNVAGDSIFKLQNTDITQSARIAHVGSIASCTVTEPAGVQPNPALCDASPQFDNVNDLDINTIDIDDLYEKDVTNNNVVSLLTTVTGIVTDLQIRKSVVGVLEEGQPGQYLLTVRNLGPDNTTKPITVTDTLPAGLVPVTAVGSGWVCGIIGQDVTCTMAGALSVDVDSTILVTTGNISAPALAGVNVSNTAVVSAGQYNFDREPGNNADTEISKILGLPVAAQERFLISVNTDNTDLGGLSGFGAGDLVLYDPATDTASLFLEESAISGASLNNLNAVHLLPNGQILLSSDTDGSSIAGQTFDEGDVVFYDPILQTATIIFDGSSVFELGQGDVDAVFVEYNGSYDPNDWDLVISTADTVTINGTAYQNNDLFQYDISTASTAILLDGFDGGVAANDVFDSDVVGNIDAAYIRNNDASLYVLSTDDATATIAPNGSSPTTYNRDSLVEFDSVNIEAMLVFDGTASPGVFGPADASRRLNALHVIEDEYYGHFAISHSGVGDTCSATTITISKHAGLTHNVDTDYVGSIIISNDINDGTWAKDATANGVLVDLGSGQARYTYTAADNGEVMLFLTQTTATSPTMNVDITNGVAQENSSEDNGIDVNDLVTSAIYLDEFNNINYSNNDGAVAYADAWTEVNDDGSPAGGGIKISGGKLLLTNPGGATFPSLLRTMDFSSYVPNTVTDPITLSFGWSRSNGTLSDSFVVEARSQSSDAWTVLQTFVAGSGAVNTSQVSIDMTAAGITPSSTTQIQFRVNAGYQVETISVDNVKVVTATNDCNVTETVDHYAITHSGFGISCLAENVTITPHTSGNVLTDPGAGVTITLSTVSNKGTWNPPLNGNGAFSSAPGTGQATYTYLAGENAIVFPFNYTDPSSDPELVNFVVQDNNVPVNTQQENLALSMASSGFRFYNDTAGNEVYPTLVAGMDSSLYTGELLTVQAIQVSDNNPLVCEDIFSPGTDVAMQLAFECIESDQCATTPIPVDVTNNGNVSSIYPVSSNSGAGVNVGGFDDITLHFESFGSYTGAQIDLNYADAGALQIHARYDIPLLDGAGVDSGNYMQGSGSNNFVVRPFAYDIDFNLDRQTNGNNNTATSWAELATDSKFFVAGSGFDTTVRAVAWQASDDDGLVNGVAVGVANDGIPDSGSDLFDNVSTPNYGNETDPLQNDLTLTHVLVSPGVVQGALTDQTFTDFASNDGSATHTVTYDEVGIINLTATFDNVAGYLGSGQGIVGDVLNVGRFVPAEFEVSNTAILGRPLVTPSASAFTYIGEEFNAEFQLTARNSLGAITQNYFGDFAKLTSASQLGFFAIDDVPAANDISYTPRVVQSATNGFPTDFSANWVGGIASLSGNLILTKQASGAEEAPITNLQIALTVLDTDLVIDANRNVDEDDGTNEDMIFVYNLLGTQEFRYGRMRVENAYGSEIPEEDGSGLIGDDLGISLVVEYFDGTSFVTNTDDIATPYNSADLSFVTGSYTDNLNASNMNTAGNVTSSSGVVYQGSTDTQIVTDTPLYLQAPGINNDGSVVIELDLVAAGLDFLQYDWRSENLGEIEDITPNGNYANNPRALVEFGEYEGHERVINWQELFVD